MISKTHTSAQKATQKTAKHKSVAVAKVPFSFSFILDKTTMFNNDILKTVQVLAVILSQN